MEDALSDVETVKPPEPPKAEEVKKVLNGCECHPA